LELTPSFLRELKRCAQRLVSDANSADSLVQEACVKLLATRAELPTEREEALAYAARVLRTALVDRALRSGAQKRGGNVVRRPLDEADLQIAFDGPDLDTALDIHDGLKRLERVDADLALLLELYYFGRYTCREIAAARGVPAGEIEERMRAARRWLQADLGSRAEG
jgi:RNA polymerase sigma-70 factor (ECF subfamily)